MKSINWVSKHIPTIEDIRAKFPAGFDITWCRTVNHPSSMDLFVEAMGKPGTGQVEEVNPVHGWVPSHPEANPQNAAMKRICQAIL